MVPAISAWLQYHLRKSTVPNFTWTINNTTGEIVATLDEHGVVHQAHVWWAYSCGDNHRGDGLTRRDFRIATLDNPCDCGIYSDGKCMNLKSFWSKKELEVSTVRGKRTYSTVLEPPTDGRWIAYMIDITYDRPKISEEEEKMLGLFPKDLLGRLEFTTQVSVFPQTFPYPDCNGDDCAAPLV